MAGDADWKPGQEALLVWVRYGPVEDPEVVRVVDVQSYKRGRKVTTDDGREWDVDRGAQPIRRWGTRTAAYDSGPYLRVLTPELRAEIGAHDNKLREKVEGALARWDDLRSGDKEALYEAAHGALSRKKGKR